MSKAKIAPGPRPGTVKIEGPWEDAVAKALTVKPPEKPLERIKIPQRAPKNLAKKKAPK